MLRVLADGLLLLGIIIMWAGAASGVGVRGTVSGLRWISASPKPIESIDMGRPRGSRCTPPTLLVAPPCWWRACAGGEEDPPLG